jgi:branched-chain amino acid aminotransferase
LPRGNGIPDAYAYVNGKIGPPAKAEISEFDRGLVLGDGLFETLRAVDFHPQFLDLHYRRLVRSARLLKLRVPLSQAALRKTVAALCRKSRLRDAAVRITLTRGRYLGGLAINPAIPPSLIVTVMPVSGPDRLLQEKGVAVAISGINKTAASGLDSRIKSINYLANIFAKAEAERKGCYEAILLGPRGEIAVLSTASFFCVLGGTVVTPPIDTGILPGITRQVLLREMRRARVPFAERAIYPRDVSRMTEAFLCSSVRGPLPITRIEKRKVGDGRVGPVFRRLRGLYAAACEHEARG